MAENRIPRESQTREKTKRAQAWRPPELLPTPEPQDGFEFRYVRMSTLGQMDPTNISSKRREGWEPVKADDHPELEYMGSDSPDSRFAENVVIGGLVLCKAPTEMVEQRNEHFREQNRAQIQSVDNNLMRENDPRMPLFQERKTKVTFGSGT